MLLIAHLLLAAASLGLMMAAVVGRFRNRAGDYDTLAHASGVSFAALFATGVGLVIEYHASIMGACLNGIFYLACLTALYVVYRKLAVSTEA